MSALEEHDDIQLKFAETFSKKRRTEPSKYTIDYDIMVNGVRTNRFEDNLKAGDIPEWLQIAADIPLDIDEPKVTVEWEVPVPGRYEPIGYLDLKIRLIHTDINIFHSDDIHILRSEDESSCKDPDHWDYGVYRRPGMVAAVEVKSYIKSIGELMRQINKYKSALPWCKCPYRYGEKVHSPKGEDHYDPVFWVVSPDDRFKDILTGQGVIFKKFG